MKNKDPLGIAQKKYIKEQVAEIVMNIAKDAQKFLLQEDAIVADSEDGITTLKKTPYKTVIEEDDEEIRIVPTFDNRIDEYSNSEVISKFGFEGNMTLTKLKNRITK